MSRCSANLEMSGFSNIEMSASAYAEGHGGDRDDE